MGKKKAGEVFIEVEADLRQLDRDLRKMENKVQSSAKRAEKKAKIRGGGLGGSAVGAVRGLGGVAAAEGLAVGLDALAKTFQRMELDTRGLVTEADALNEEILSLLASAPVVGPALGKITGFFKSIFEGDNAQKAKELDETWTNIVNKQIQFTKDTQSLQDSRLRLAEAQGLTPFQQSQNLRNRQVIAAERKGETLLARGVTPSVVRQVVENLIRAAGDEFSAREIARETKRLDAQDLLDVSARTFRTRELPGRDIPQVEEKRRDRSLVGTISSALGGFTVGQQQRVQDQQLEELKKQTEAIKGIAAGGAVIT